MIIIGAPHLFKPGEIVTIPRINTPQGYQHDVRAMIMKIVTIEDWIKFVVSEGEDRIKARGFIGRQGPTYFYEISID